MKKITWHIEVKKLAELIMNDKNPRRITEKGIRDLRRSIEKFGLAEPIVVNLNGNVIGGHARIFSLEQQNETQADCYLPSRLLNPDEERELSRRLNRSAGDWDNDLLSSMDSVEELRDWGWNDWELGFGKEEKLPESKKCPKCGHEWQ